MKMKEIVGEIKIKKRIIIILDEVNKKKTIKK